MADDSLPAQGVPVYSCMPKWGKKITSMNNNDKLISTALSVNIYLRLFSLIAHHKDREALQIKTVHAQTTILV